MLVNALNSSNSGSDLDLGRHGARSLRECALQFIFYILNDMFDLRFSTSST